MALCPLTAGAQPSGKKNPPRMERNFCSPSPKVRGVALGGLQAGYRAVNPDPVQDGRVSDAFRAWAEFMRSLLVF